MSPIYTDLHFPQTGHSYRQVGQPKDILHKKIWCRKTSLGSSHQPIVLRSCVCVCVCPCTCAGMCIYSGMVERNGNCFHHYCCYLAVIQDCFCHQPEDIWPHKDRNHSVHFCVLDLPCTQVSVVENQVLAQRTLYVHKYKS